MSLADRVDAGLSGINAEALSVLPCCVRFFQLNGDVQASCEKPTHFDVQLMSLAQCLTQPASLCTPFTCIGFESSRCCTSGCLKLKGGLWAADLASGF